MKSKMPKILRTTTVPVSLQVLLRGQHQFMQSQGLEVVGVSSSGKELTDVSVSEGIRVEELEMTRTISPVKDIKSLWEFYKLCKREKPAIVHSHTPKAGIVAMLGAWLAGVPIRMHTVSGLPLMEATGLKRKVLNAVERLTYAFATGVYPNSKGLEQFILKEGFTTPSKLKVIANGSSNGIDTSHFSAEHFDSVALNELRKSLGIDSSDYKARVPTEYLQNWRDRIGDKMDLEILYVDEIPVEASGKFRIVKNNIKHLI